MMSERAAAAAAAAAAAGCVCYAELLALELLAACIRKLTLRSLPNISGVNHRWRDAAQIAFASQLRWRSAARCLQLPLPVPVSPVRSSLAEDPIILRNGFVLAFSRPSGDLLVQMIDPQTASVRTLCFAGGASLEPHEAARRTFADHGPFNAGVGGVIGYRQGLKGMSFFSGLSGDNTVSDSVWVIEGKWENILTAGKVVFLLRSCSWWDDEEITADVLDLDSGGRTVVDVTPMRDALRLQLSGKDIPQRCAVSAADGYFIFHLHTQRGTKLAAALRLPMNIDKQDSGGVQPAADAAAVAFAQHWPATHAISRLSKPNEHHCGGELFLVSLF